MQSRVVFRFQLPHLALAGDDRARAISRRLYPELTGVLRAVVAVTGHKDESYVRIVEVMEAPLDPARLRTETSGETYYAPPKDVTRAVQLGGTVLFKLSWTAAQLAVVAAGTTYRAAMGEETGPESEPPDHPVVFDLTGVCGRASCETLVQSIMTRVRYDPDLNGSDLHPLAAFLATFLFAPRVRANAMTRTLLFDDVRQYILRTVTYVSDDEYMTYLDADPMGTHAEAFALIIGKKKIGMALGMQLSSFGARNLMRTRPWVDRVVSPGELAAMRDYLGPPSLPAERAAFETIVGNLAWIAKSLTKFAMYGHATHPTRVLDTLAFCEPPFADGLTVTRVQAIDVDARIQRLQALADKANRSPAENDAFIDLTAMLVDRMDELGRADEFEAIDAFLAKARRSKATDVKTMAAIAAKKARRRELLHHFKEFPLPTRAVPALVLDFIDIDERYRGRGIGPLILALLERAAIQWSPASRVKLSQCFIGTARMTLGRYGYVRDPDAQYVKDLPKYAAPHAPGAVGHQDIWWLAPRERLARRLEQPGARDALAREHTSNAHCESALALLENPADPEVGHKAVRHTLGLVVLNGFLPFPRALTAKWRKHARNLEHPQDAAASNSERMLCFQILVIDEGLMATHLVLVALVVQSLYALASAFGEPLVCDPRLSWVPNMTRSFDRGIGDMPLDEYWTDELTAPLTTTGGNPALELFLNTSFPGFQPWGYDTKAIPAREGVMTAGDAPAPAAQDPPAAPAAHEPDPAISSDEEVGLEDAPPADDAGEVIPAKRKRRVVRTAPPTKHRARPVDDEVEVLPAKRKRKTRKEVESSGDEFAPDAEEASAPPPDDDDDDDDDDDEPRPLPPKKAQRRAVPAVPSLVAPDAEPPAAARERGIKRRAHIASKKQKRAEAAAAKARGEAEGGHVVWPDEFGPLPASDSEETDSLATDEVPDPEQHEDTTRFHPDDLEWPDEYGPLPGGDEQESDSIADDDPMDLTARLCLYCDARHWSALPLKMTCCSVACWEAYFIM